MLSGAFEFMTPPGLFGHCDKCGDWRLIIDGNGRCFKCTEPKGPHPANCVCENCEERSRGLTFDGEQSFTDSRT